jgi:hypothetical protein
MRKKIFIKIDKKNEKKKESLYLCSKDKEDEERKTLTAKEK